MGGVFNNLPEDQPVEFSLGSASLTLAIPELISTIGTGVLGRLLRSSVFSDQLL